jgi:pimeloyl-ACP methyl ester carboxylesterase
MYLRIAVFLFPILVGASCNKRPSDRFIKIDGKDQHILDLGSGEPVVVFVSGFGSHLTSYDRVQRAVSGFTRTISYDRAGVGKSQLTVANRSLDTMVDELNRILEQENIPGPYVLVGHSSGGHIVRYFADTYPAKVAGIVLIDPTPEYMDDEIRRLKTPTEVKSYDSLNEHGRDPSWAEGVKGEADYFDANELKIKKIRFPDQIPITVLTAMNMRESRHSFLKGVNQIKLALHKKWLTDAPHIRHVLAHRSGHYIHIDEPKLVISEIRTMVKK